MPNGYFPKFLHASSWSPRVGDRISKYTNALRELINLGSALALYLESHMVTSSFTSVVVTAFSPFMIFARMYPLIAASKESFFFFAAIHFINIGVSKNLIPTFNLPL